MKHQEFIEQCKAVGIKKLADKSHVDGYDYHVDFDHNPRRNITKAILYKTGPDGEQQRVLSCFNDDAETVAYYM